jgi:hypothetical protein
MKKTSSFLLIAILFSGFIHAQTNAVKNNPTGHFNFIKANNIYVSNLTFKTTIEPPYGVRGKAYYQEKLRKAKALKIAGIVMASVGGGALAGTIAGTVYLVRNRTKLSDGGVADVYKIYATAVGGTALSAGLIASGIPLSISGSRKSKKYKKTIEDNNF